jgi:pyridoxine 4-dehydrogenase
MRGRTADFDGVSVTRMGLGTNRLRNTPENHVFLSAAVDAGIGLIDTAHLYTDGASEAAIGAALAPFPKELVVETKGGYQPGEGRPDRLRAQLEQSFERLRTDRIGIYYLHRPDPKTPIEESVGLLEEHRRGGRIGGIGLSQATIEHVQRARAVAPIAAVQEECNLGERGYDDLVDFCAAEGIPYVAFYPLHGADTPATREIAARYDATSQQLALAWLLKRSPTILPIPGSLSIEHVRENLAALELELSDEDYEALTAA